MLDKIGTTYYNKGRRALLRRLARLSTKSLAARVRSGRLTRFCRQKQHDQRSNRQDANHTQDVPFVHQLPPPSMKKFCCGGKGACAPLVGGPTAYYVTTSFQPPRFRFGKATIPQNFVLCQTFLPQQTKYASAPACRLHSVRQVIF